MNMSTVNSAGVDLQVFTYGDEKKQPIVLVHGYPDNHSVWEPVAKLLADKYFVITYDVRGAGGSDVPRKQADLECRRSILAPATNCRQIPSPTLASASPPSGTHRSAHSRTTPPQDKPRQNRYAR